MENTFSILSQWFHMYQWKLAVSPQVATFIVQATKVLHNYLTNVDDITTSEVKKMKTVPKAIGMQDLLNSQGNRGSEAAIWM